MRRDFSNDNVSGYIELHNHSVIVEVHETRPGGRGFKKRRTFQEKESARKVYASFVGIINTGARGLSFTDLAR